MTMTPSLRKLVLTAHITFSVGWIGAVAAEPVSISTIDIRPFIFRAERIENTI